MGEIYMRLVNVEREERYIGQRFTLSFETERKACSFSIITQGPIDAKYFTERDRFFTLLEITEDFKEQL